MTGPEEVRAAVAEVRREARKAAAVDAAVDAGLVLLAVNLAVAVFGVDLPVPAALPGPASAVPAVAAALLAGVASGVLRARRYTVETFEAVNPELGVSLRTARDAADLERDGVMARRLYEDAVDRLRTASSYGLIGGRSLAVRTLVVAVLAVATVHVAVVGVEVSPLADRGGPGAVDGDAGSAESAATPERDGFADNDSVLGEPKTPTGGEEALAANVSSSHGGRGDGDAGEYEERGFPGEGGDVSAPRAGFDDPEAVEDAELIRDYAVSLNGSDTDD